MVNSKNVTFKVNRQVPISHPPAQAYGTVINCRKAIGKRAAKEKKEAQSHYVAFTNVDGNLKRKWGVEEDDGANATSSFMVYQSLDAQSGTLQEAPLQKWQPPKPPRPRKSKLPSKGVDLDCWFIILSFADPAQLLLMRSKIPSCYHFLSNNPTLWKHSRNYHHADLPEPPSELNEHQYADLRHDHGCQSCKAPNTRKTYWAFLRRWCKTCLNSKTEKEHDALVVLREAHGDESLVLQKCLPTGVYDSWGNFVGVGPATTHALKTVYLIRDVKALSAEYSDLKAKNQNVIEWPTEFGNWYKAKTDMVEERKVFAHKMEAWEETIRNDRSFEYSAKKSARKQFFQARALDLSPPITAQEIEHCASYKRAIAIPKEPNNTSWLQLKPKLEKEAAAHRAKGGPPENRTSASSASQTGISTPVSTMEPQHAYTFHPGYSLPLNHPPLTMLAPPSLPSQNHNFIQLPPMQYHYGHPPPPGPVSHMILAPPPPRPPPGHLNHTGLPHLF